jgi:hypothetical protein
MLLLSAKQTILQFVRSKDEPKDVWRQLYCRCGITHASQQTTNDEIVVNIIGTNDIIIISNYKMNQKSKLRDIKFLILSIGYEGSKTTTTGDYDVRIVML